MLRHAPTAWNESGRIQGRRDVALSDRGRSLARGRRVPSPWRDASWISSPLVRAAETARLMGTPAPALEPRLQEMDWGRWEGFTLDHLRAREGDAMGRNEARGLDFRPAGGESPRDVRERLASWLQSLPADRPRVVAVTHKGVIRCALSLAAGWDMREAYPRKLDWSCGHCFGWRREGRLEILELDVALTEPAP